MELVFWWLVAVVGMSIIPVLVYFMTRRPKPLAAGELFDAERLIARWVVDETAWAEFLRVDGERRARGVRLATLVMLAFAIIVGGLGLALGGDKGPTMAATAGVALAALLVIQAVATGIISGRDRRALPEVVVGKTALRVGARLGRWDVGTGSRLDKVVRDPARRCLVFHWSAYAGRGTWFGFSMLVPLPAGDAEEKLVLAQFASHIAPG